MKLYRVLTYEELYFRSLYRPILYNAAEEHVKSYEVDPAAFVNTVIATASIEDGLWLFEGENEKLWMWEVVKMAGSAPPELWSRWKILQERWYVTGPRTPELWQQIRQCGQEIWKLGNQQARDAWTAQRFWETVRSSATWQMLYDKCWNSMTPQLQNVLGKQFARDAADSYVGGFLKGRVSAKEIREALNRPSVMDYIEKVLAWIAAFGGAVLAQVALLGVAAGCIAALILNPKEWGRRVTHFYGARHLMVYDEFLWWADLIGRSPKGQYYYKCCAELSAKRLTHKASYGEPSAYEDIFELTTWPVPVEEIDNWYWLLWPTKIEAEFVGLCVRRNDPLLTVAEAFRKNEAPPSEPYLDVSGNLKYRRPAWWKDIVGEACMRPAKDWCKEYYHYVAEFPS